MDKNNLKEVAAFMENEGYLTFIKKKTLYTVLDIKWTVLSKKTMFVNIYQPASLFNNKLFKENSRVSTLDFLHEFSNDKKLIFKIYNFLSLETASSMLDKKFLSFFTIIAKG